nr:hypothetical protein Iba_chr07cCG3850 [Ipomoea batatas]
MLGHPTGNGPSMAMLSRRHMAPIREANQHQLSRLLPSPEVAPLHFQVQLNNLAFANDAGNCSAGFPALPRCTSRSCSCSSSASSATASSTFSSSRKSRPSRIGRSSSSLRSPGIIYAGLTLSLTLSPSRISRWTARSWWDFHQAMSG